MMMTNPGRQDPSLREQGDQFATTHWSVVFQAGQPDVQGRQDALAALCHAYWPPLYSFLRKRGCNRHQAEEYTQAFFARLLEKNDIGQAVREKGRFRTFLLACLKHFISNERDRDRALKRGGGAPKVSLDFTNAEDKLLLEPAHEMTPEKLFDRHWALTVLEQAMTALREDASASGKLDLFEVLSPMLADRAERGSYAEPAHKLGITESHARKLVQRLRARYGQLLREIVGRTVADPAEIDAEMRDLQAAVSR